MNFSQPLPEFLLFLVVVEFCLSLSIELKIVLNHDFPVSRLQLGQAGQNGRPKPFLLPFIQVRNILLPNQVNSLGYGVNVALLGSVHLDPVMNVATIDSNS